MDSSSRDSSITWSYKDCDVLVIKPLLLLFCKNEITDMPQPRKTDFCWVEKNVHLLLSGSLQRGTWHTVTGPSVDEGESANILFQLKVVGHFTHCHWLPFAEDSEPSVFPLLTQRRELEYSFSCFTCCFEFCPFYFCLSGSFNFVSP